jgi:hypothetical protein
MSIPTPDESQVATAIQQGVEESRIAIQDTVKKLVSGVSCDQSSVGDSMTVRIIASRDFYDPGKFQLADSPQALDLAKGMARVYNAFKGVRSDQFKVDLNAKGTADAIPVGHLIDYKGRSMSCLVGGRFRVLEPGPSALDNELLACARAAALVQYLQESRLPIDTNLQGREHGGKDGRFRSVDVEIVFIGILRYAPNPDFCGT